MDNKYEPCSICELYICGYECHNDKCPVAKMKAEVERLQGAVQEWVDGKCLSQKHLLMIGKLQNEIEQARADAIREFAEKLKAKSDYCYLDNIRMVAYRILDKDLDSLVKEMTEEKK